MQFLLILVAVAAAMLLDVRASQAYQGPWCAGTSRGHAFVYNCSMRTFDQCVSEVIAGNRGFCSPNPYYRGHRRPSTQGQTKALLLLIAIRRVAKSALIPAKTGTGGCLVSSA
jgi:Protein of unknown function (DUF3551)